AAAQVKSIEAVGDAIVKGERAAAAKAAKAAQDRDELRRQELDNRLAAAQLIADPAQSLAAQEAAERAIAKFYHKRIAATTGLARAQAVGEKLQAQAALKALTATGAAGPGLTAAGFFSEASNEFNLYGGNVGGALSGQDARALLGQLVTLAREGNRD